MSQAALREALEQDRRAFFRQGSRPPALRQAMAQPLVEYAQRMSAQAEATLGVGLPAYAGFLEGLASRAAAKAARA